MAAFKTKVDSLQQNKEDMSQIERDFLLPIKLKTHVISMVLNCFANKKILSLNSEFQIVVLLGGAPGSRAPCTTRENHFWTTLACCRSCIRGFSVLKDNNPDLQEACIDYICDNIESICNPITAGDGEKRLQFKEEEVRMTSITNSEITNNL